MKKLYIVTMLIVMASSLTACGKKDDPQKQSNESQYQEALKAGLKETAELVMPESEINKLVKSKEGEIYYITSDNRRYIFPTRNIFQTWFPDNAVESIPEKTLEQLYESPLQGNVFIKPGALIQTETDPKVYLVIRHGAIKEVEDLTFLPPLYGQQWEENVLDIENRYFTNYRYDTAVTDITEMPIPPKNLTIESNQ